MRKLLFVLSYLFAAFPNSVLAETSAFEVVRPRAIEVLRHELHGTEQWIKVHAAEALLQMGYSEGVEAQFQKELKLHGEQPRYRTGIYRVLARATVVPKKRSDLVEQIKAIFFDLNATDREHAVETLGKLQIALTDGEQTNVAQYAQEEQSPFALWVLAQQGNADALAKLKGMKESKDPVTVFRATFCLEQLQPQSKEVWQAAGGRAKALSGLKSKNPSDRREACQMLGNYGEANDARKLSAMLEDPDPDVRVFSALALLRIERRKEFGMVPVDWLVVFCYAASMLLIGWYYGRKAKTADDYLLGGRNMKSWMVGLSLFATLLSTITYMSYPGEIIKHGPMIAAGLFCVPPVIWVVGWFLIPAFMKVPVTSANEILEIQMGLSIRLLGSFFFLALRLLWMAMVIHITAKAVLGPVMGLDPKYFPLACFLVGAITVVYTSSGGLKAVILTDVIQTFILFLGAILSIVIISMHFGGLSWFPTEWAPSWDSPVFWFDPEARITFAGAVMMGFIWYICTAGSDQMAVQRYLATSSAKEARTAFTISMVTNVLVQVLLALLGFALVSYFLANPHELADGMNVRSHADRVFPHFIVCGLPAGITGLVVAALLAAAMSSLSSGLNSACTIITVDFFDRFGKKQLDEKHYVKRARTVSWGIGAGIVLLSLSIDKVEGNLTEIANKVGNLLVAPLFLLFFMAMFVPFANVTGVWVGATASVAMAVWIAFYEFLGLSFIWIMPCSLITGVGAGCLASLLTGGKKKACVAS